MTRAATSESYDSGTARVRRSNHGVHGVGRRGGPDWSFDADEIRAWTDNNEAKRLAYQREPNTALRSGLAK